MVIGMSKEDLYYINSMRKTLFADKLTDEYIQFINRYYTQDISYTDFKKKHRKMLQSMQDTKAMGINLTTMHGLKGLEFDNVFIIDMDDKLYPGNELKDSSLTPDQRTHIELESRRLLYVTLTRARHNLVLFFNKNCPSRYLKFFMDNTDLEELYKVSESMSMVDYNPSINKTMQEFDTTYKDSEFIYEDECDTTFIKPEPLKEENKQEIVKQEEQTVVNVDDEAWDGLLADVNADNLSIDDEDLFTSLFSIDTNSDDVDFDSIYDDGAVDSTSIVNSSKQSDDVDFDSLFDNDTVNDNEVDVASFVSDSDVASNENNSTVDDSISVLGLTVESKEMASLLNDVIEGNMPQPKPDFRWAETDDTNKPKLNTILGLLRSRDNNE